MVRCHHGGIAVPLPAPCLDGEVQTQMWSLEVPRCRIAAEMLHVLRLVVGQETLTTLTKSC